MDNMLTCDKKLFPNIKLFWVQNEQISFELKMNKRPIFTNELLITEERLIRKLLLFIICH